MNGMTTSTPVMLLGMTLAALLMVPTAGEAQCNGKCDDPPNCGETMHAFVEGYELDEFDGGYHGHCLDGPCCFLDPGSENCRHPACGVTNEEEQEELQALVEAVDSGDWVRARTIVSKHPARFAVTPSRGSIQVFSACTPGQVVGNLPVPNDRLAFLSGSASERWRWGGDGPSWVLRTVLIASIRWLTPMAVAWS